MARQFEHDGQESDYVVALTRLFTEALNARDYEAMRALVAEDVELRGPRGSALRGYPAASELLEAVAHFDLVAVRTALEELEQEDGAIRVTVRSANSFTTRNSSAPPSSGSAMARSRATRRSGTTSTRRSRPVSVPTLRTVVEAAADTPTTSASGIGGIRAQIVDGGTGILLDYLCLIRRVLERSGVRAAA